MFFLIRCYGKKIAHVLRNLKPESGVQGAKCPHTGEWRLQVSFSRSRVKQLEQRPLWAPRAFPEVSWVSPGEPSQAWLSGTPISTASPSVSTPGHTWRLETVPREPPLSLRGFRVARAACRDSVQDESWDTQ